MRRALIFAAVAAAVSVSSSVARGEKCPNMMVVLDRSGSMAGSKWETAIKSINDFVPAHQSALRFGLIVFPDFSGNACNGGELRVACDFYSAGRIAGSLSSIGNPGGFTPTAQVIAQAAQLAELSDTTRRRFVVLLTDGDPTCPDEKDPEGALALTVKSLEQLKANGVKTFIIGFGQDVTPSSLDRMAEAGGTARTDGLCSDPKNRGGRIACKYFEATDRSSLDAAFSSIASIAQGELSSGCDDSCYALGSCQSGQRCVKQIYWYENGKYQLNLGKCEPDPCASIKCETGFCREGVCVPACEKGCTGLQLCVDGQCVDNPCSSNTNLSSLCACDQSCSKFLVCLGGECVDDPCRSIKCPQNAPYCSQGNCYSAATASPPDSGQAPTTTNSANSSSSAETGSGCSSAGKAFVSLWPLWILICWALLSRFKKRGGSA